MVTLPVLIGLGLLLPLAAVRLTRVTGWWAFEALDTLALYAFLPLLSLGVPALLLRSRALTMLFALSLAFFAQQFGPRLISLAGPPGSAVVTAQEHRPRLRLMTMNLHAPNDDPTPFL